MAGAGALKGVGSGAGLSRAGQKQGRRMAAAGVGASLCRERSTAPAAAVVTATGKAAPAPSLDTLIARLAREPRTSRSLTIIRNLGTTNMNAMTKTTTAWPLHARFDGPIVMIGFGSIGRGTLPLIERHIGFDRTKFVVIAPDDEDRRLLDERKLSLPPRRDHPGELS